MAKFVIGNGTAADMKHFDIGGFDIIGSDDLTLSHTQFTVDSTDGFFLTYTGTGFHDNNADDIPDEGTITKWDADQNGHDVFTFSDFSMEWEDYWGFVTADDGEGFLSTVFSGNDKIIGANKNDILVGFDGNDEINGGKGRDVLEGKDGRDKLIGGLGHDDLTGGGGADKFIFNDIADSPNNGEDVIRDWQDGKDLIDLRGIDADPSTEEDDAFFLGGDTFTNSVGELIQDVFKDGKFHLQGDIDGDGFADFDIKFDGKLSLDINDILF